MRVCAAKGCDVRTTGKFFCKDHQTVDSRKRTDEPECPWEDSDPPVESYTFRDQAKAQSPRKMVEKAVVRWYSCAGIYIATHSGYFSGSGDTPGAALRNMTVWDDDCPF